MRRKSFKHGVHPEENKAFTNTSLIEFLPLPDEVFIPLQQHIGRPCTPLVGKKEDVKTGQIIGKAEGFISSPVHSSVTGVVKEVGLFMGAFGSRVPMIHIQRTSEDNWQYLKTLGNWQQETPESLGKQILDAGIVGMGGAAFPAHVKFKVQPEKPIDTFILNGCECEPFLTCDHRIMVEKTDETLTGVSIIMKVLGVTKGYIGIEANKPDAIICMRDRIVANGLNYQVVPLKVKYPQGAEKMLIKALTRKTVPAGGLPIDIGVIVSNVGTAIAVKEAVIEGKPLINRIVAVTGDALRNPKNLEIRVGTQLKQAIEFCGGLTEKASQVIMGGPMMGFSQFDLSAPIVKSTSGVVCTAISDNQLQEIYPCIRCNSCVSACPMFLLPNRLSRLIEKKFYDAAESYGIMNCIECGCCSFACPSRIPILQWIRIGKYTLNALKRKAAV